MNLVVLLIFTNLVAGKVVDIETAEPLQAHITIENLNQIIFCDSLGEFSTPEITVGKYNLTISHVGFENKSIEVTVAENDTVYLNITLNQTMIPIEPIDVQSEKPVTISVQTIEQEEFQNIPGAEKDVFRAVQTLPGVNAPSDYLGIMYVRGGELYENNVFLDGIEILSPYHYFGVGSVFNTDLIERFEFYSGTFPARYGDAMSSVLTIESREPTNKTAGDMSLDFMEANWLYLCPVNNKLSFFFSAKRNYLGMLLKSFGVIEDIILPYYLDFQGKVLFNSNIGTFSVSGLRSQEESDIETTFDYDKLKIEIDGKSHSFATSWYKQFMREIRCQAHLFYGNLERHLYGEAPGPYGETETSTEEVAVEKYGISINTFMKISGIDCEIGCGGGHYSFMHSGPKVEDILYGIEIFNFSLDVDTSDYYGFLYATQRFPLIKNFVFECGGRIDRFPTIQGIVFSPRVQLIYIKNPVVYIGYGHQHQLPPLEYELEEIQSSYARCFNFGIEYLIMPTLLTKIEVYNKNYNNLVSEHYTDIQEKYFETDGYGTASGIEVSLRRYRIGSFWGWISYTYSLSKRTSPYDLNYTVTHGHRPHIFNIIFGTNSIKGLELGIKFQLASGTAYSEVIGKQWSNPGFGSGDWIPVYAPEKTYLPLYQRLDLHIEKSFGLFGFNGAFYITILNVFNHQNIQGYFYNYDVTKRKTFYMIPRVPLLGVRLKF
ncbi:hypothetical protein AMJ52_07850 [candidate division TA06 bacterium DG_78]|uniref:TonB-dependent receptor plug domain-containing protein n=1 Tax=candidate division TA06 bacterium DG_78 TaxID=1703772 RepID=A0A0S7YC90_UNCT6|nr:MAG: hypothetical protein AMJ52_07850 [candidate division TA06 bacterium DG_78]